jgi:hypothetical protein
MYTLQEKTQLTHHTLSTLSPHMALDHTYLMWSTYSNFREVTNRFEQVNYPREEGLQIQSTTRRLTDLQVRTQLLSQNTQ